MSEKRISIVVGEETWRAARLRAVAEGMTFQDLGLVWFGTYGGGGTVTASTELTVAPRDLAAGGSDAVVDGSDPGTPGVRQRGTAVPTTDSPPAARPCSQAFKHHINHTGRPCKECGYPVKGAA